jgi:PAS domain-containing protein
MNGEYMTHDDVLKRQDIPEDIKDELTRSILESKRREEMLWESEELFRTIFESTSASMAIFEPDTIISAVNDAYCEVSGYKMDELIGRNLDGTYTPS